MNLKDDVVITKDNVKTLGEKIALCAIKNARRFANGTIDKLYTNLQHDIFYNNRFSDGYDIAQESICFLCSYLGHKLGEICIPNIHKKLDSIRMGCYKHLYQYIRKERKVLEQIDIENTIIKVDADLLLEPENYARVNLIIKKLNLNKKELAILKCCYNNMTYDTTAEILKINRRTVARIKQRIRNKYLALSLI